MDSRLIVGWREWASLPDLGIPALKAKVDTGARTSTLHAFDVAYFEQDTKPWVRFKVHPLRRRQHLILSCEAEVFERRVVSDSGGHREERPIILTRVVLGDDSFTIQISLTNRDTMLFPMLIGRRAMQGRLIVDPDASYSLGRGKGKVYDTSNHSIHTDS